MDLPTIKKALLINNDEKLYGTLAEIGAGQEVARHFFQAGLASKTIAKSISAYDMTFSDEIYGKAERYVSKDRLLKMFDHEYSLLKDRLNNDPKRAGSSFFAFANTVATNSSLNYCHGWVGIRFNRKNSNEINDIVLNVKMLDPHRLQQQEALGILGVNLIYAALLESDKIDCDLIEILQDNLGNQRLEIGYISLNGKELEHFDQRKLCLELVNKELSRAILFNKDGYIETPSDRLYNKKLLTLRGTFRPITQANLEIIENSLKQLNAEKKDEHPFEVLFEITMKHKTTEEEVSLQDYLNRVDCINATGHSVLISKFDFFYELKSFLYSCSINKLALVVGATFLEQLFNEESYSHLQGGILNAFGQLFSKSTQLLIYPYKTGDICLTSKSFFPDSQVLELYKYLLTNKKIIDIYECDDIHPSTLSRAAHKMLTSGDPEWEKLIPKEVVQLIKTKNFFGYKK